MISPPDPPLSSERVELRLFRPGDAAAVVRACRDPDIPRFTMMPAGMTDDDARAWIELGLAWWPKGVARFAVTVASSDDCVGQVGVQFDFPMHRAEAFYWLTPDARGKGFATHALELVTRWAFDACGVARVHLVTFPENLPSQRVAERCGFAREGLLRAWEPVKGAQPDLCMYGRVATDPRPLLDGE